MSTDAALGRALALVRDLRRLCPWDGAQTPETLRPYLVELHAMLRSPSRGT